MQVAAPASSCWVASVFVYDELDQPGDQLQLAAAVAWTLSNLLTLPEIFVQVDTASGTPTRCKRDIRRPPDPVGSAAGAAKNPAAKQATLP